MLQNQKASKTIGKNGREFILKYYDRKNTAIRLVNEAIPLIHRTNH